MLDRTPSEVNWAKFSYDQGYASVIYPAEEVKILHNFIVYKAKASSFISHCNF